MCSYTALGPRLHTITEHVTEQNKFLICIWIHISPMIHTNSHVGWLIVVMIFEAQHSFVGEYVVRLMTTEIWLFKFSMLLLYHQWQTCHLTLQISQSVKTLRKICKFGGRNSTQLIWSCLNFRRKTPCTLNFLVVMNLSIHINDYTLNLFSLK